jgi:hypothetical protein
LLLPFRLLWLTMRLRHQWMNLPRHLILILAIRRLLQP